MAARLALIVLLLSGCASGRRLSKEEDAEMRAACEPKGGCVVIPRDAWAALDQAVTRCLGL